MTPWNQVEADRLLLGDLKTEVAKIKARNYGGKPPRALTVLLDDALAIAARFIRDHEAEAAHGWDSLDPAFCSDGAR